MCSSGDIYKLAVYSQQLHVASKEYFAVLNYPYIPKCVRMLVYSTFMMHELCHWCFLLGTG